MDNDQSYTGVINQSVQTSAETARSGLTSTAYRLLQIPDIIKSSAVYTENS
jgi:hypothetical protein